MSPGMARLLILVNVARRYVLVTGYKRGKASSLYLHPSCPIPFLYSNIPFPTPPQPLFEDAPMNCTLKTNLMKFGGKSLDSCHPDQIPDIRWSLWSVIESPMSSQAWYLCLPGLKLEVQYIIMYNQTRQRNRSEVWQYDRDNIELTCND